MISLLFLGDIVGRVARAQVIRAVPRLRAHFGLDFVVVNCENAAGGFGITPKICDELFACGIDVLTTGNHAFDKAEISSYMASQPKLLRPQNMAMGLPGEGAVIIEGEAGWRLGVINIMANLFMAENDNAFTAVDDLLSKLVLRKDVHALCVDFHGEATSEKMAMGHYLDGRVSMIVGTHTHIPTADTRILEKGTAYQTDAGMCGDYNSVIGMDKKAATARFIGQNHLRLAPAKGEASLCGVLVHINPQTGLAQKVVRIQNGGISDMVLLTNSPKPKVVGLDAYGLNIVGTRKISELG